MSLVNISRIFLHQCQGSSLLHKKIFAVHKFVPIIQPLLQAREFAKLILPLDLDDFYARERPDVPDDFRHVYPEFLPDPKPEWRNRLREKLEREDMLNRRSVAPIPEFFVGSILAVKISDPNASGKANRFVGICMKRGGTGLRAWFILRNIVDHQGVEILYEMYCPLILSIEVLRLEKRLDDDLTYLRDCFPEYSTFPFNTEAEYLPDGVPVPVNPIQAKLKPKPWHERWERRPDLKGVELPRLKMLFAVKAKRHEKPWEKYDLMKEYRATIPEEEQAQIYRELVPRMPKLEASRRRGKKIKMQDEGKN